MCTIRFALKLDDNSLNGELEPLSSNFASSLSSLLPSSLRGATLTQDPTLAVEAKTDVEVVIDTSRLRTKKKKKVKGQTNVVLLDTNTEVESSDAVTVTSPPTPQITSPIQPSDQTDELNSRLNLLLNSQISSQDAAETSEALPPVIYNSVDLREKTTSNKPDCDSSNPQGMYGTSVLDNQRDPPTAVVTSASLTPIANKSIGALFPVMTGRASLLSEEASEENIPDPAPRLEDLDYGSNPLNCKTNQSTENDSSLKKDELKHALLSVMEKKDELEEQVKSMKKLLEKEINHVAEVKQELSDIKQINKEKQEKQEAKIGILLRENELLKHQLKKYVGAVQKLRDGPHAYETLAKLEGSKDSEGNRYIDYHYEASEYEKKLIQVAEMHGELLEFNESLQKVLQNKDGTISRLREELVSLRGPLPDSEDRLTEDTVSLSSSCTGSLNTGSSRPLVNLWIPTVFLTGSGSSKHHVYQVYIRIRETEWNVFRRYSQFYQLHSSLRKKDPIISSFDFPPKKSVGNRNESFVEDRRKMLQSYMRSVVNYLVTTDVNLSLCSDKETLISLIPFFGDSTISNASERPP